VITRKDITGLILCGGAGTRFDGRDKPLELLAGSPLFGHVRERLLPQVARIVISCNRNIDAYARFRDTLVVDDEPPRGPLGGVLAGLMRVETDLVFVCPGDAPFLSRTLVARLAVALDDERADVALPHDGTRRQHLFMLIRRSLAPALGRYLDTGSRSVQAFIDQQRAAIVDAALDGHAFVNINSAEDLAAAAALRTS
jgi:molybdenum cofactor guanylyltransferase